MRARQADSTIAAELLEQARQLRGRGREPRHRRHAQRGELAAVRTQLEVARNAADRARLDLLRSLDLPSATRLELADSLGPAPLDLRSIPTRRRLSPRAPRGAGRRTRPDPSAPAPLTAIRAENLPSLGVSGTTSRPAAPGSLAGSYTCSSS